MPDAPDYVPSTLADVAQLRGQRVMLTPVRAEDTERIYDACQDANFARWLSWARDGYTWEQAQQFATEFAPQSWAKGNPLWAIRSIDEAGNPGELAGAIDLRDQGEGAWEIGFWMHRDSQGKGLMTEANWLVIRAAFEELGAKRLLHYAGVGNDRSRRIARNLGFVPEGVRRIEDGEGTVERQWQSAMIKPDWDRFSGNVDVASFPVVPPAEVLPGDRPADLVAEFHSVYDAPNRVARGDAPSVDFDRVHMRMSLIKEEVTELAEAVYGETAAAELAAVFAGLTDQGERDVVGAADALADLVYVIYGMALESGIDLDRVLAEVHSSNLSKLMPDGSVRRREDGKILKGPHFREPDIALALGLAEKPAGTPSERPEAMQSAARTGDDGR